MYWFEINSSKRKSLVVKKLDDSNNKPPKYFLLSIDFFSYDLFSYIIVTDDNDKDIYFFISNVDTLYKCVADSRDGYCFNYFITFHYEDYFLKRMTLMDSLKSSFRLLKLVIFSFIKPHSLQSKISKITDKKSLTHFYDNPKGMFYDKIEHVLYFSDFGNSRVIKLSFDNDKTQRDLYMFANIENVLNYDNDQTPISSLMHVIHNNRIFWVNFEEGLQTTLFNNTCSRTILRDVKSSNSTFVTRNIFIKKKLHFRNKN